MTLNEFQKKCERTMNTQNGRDMLFHAALGLASEAGEVAGILQKYLQGHTIDDANALEEIGDVMWFVAECCTAFGFSMDEVAQGNVDKLAVRYKEHFTPEESIARVDHQGG